MLVFGVDVSKKELVVSDGSRCWRVPNTRAGIMRLVKGLDKDAVVAMESTSDLHLGLADAAHGAGLSVYVLNPKHVKRYRDALPVRGKTDPIDAQVIARFARNERERLALYKPMPEPLRRLRALLLRRSRLVSSKGCIRQSLEGCKDLLGEMTGVLARIDKAIARIDGMIAGLLAGSEPYRRLQQIPGVGKLTGAGLLASLDRAEARSADAFVAFLGLDLIANDSGEMRGKRRLSKMGDSETRRLVFMCAMAAIRTATWKPIYEAYRTRYSTIQAIVALSRRIVRTAWSMHAHATAFEGTRIVALT